MAIMEKKISVANVIRLVLFITTICGVWYSNKHQVDLLESKVIRLETELHNTDLKVLQQEVNYLKKEIGELEYLHKENNKNKKRDKKK